MKKKSILITSLLALSGLSSQAALASSAYINSGSLTYTISATTKTGDLNNLVITDFVDIYTSIDDENSSTSVSTFGSSYSPYMGLGIDHTNIFTSHDSIANGSVSSTFYSDFIVDFENDSGNSTDVFDISIAYSYTLFVKASGQNAYTEIAGDVFNANNDWLGGEIVSVSEGENPNYFELSFSDTYNFSLNNTTTETFIIETYAYGSLEASPSPVPVPAAFWLFGTALMAFPSIRKFSPLKNSNN